MPAIHSLLNPLFMAESIRGFFPLSILPFTFPFTSFYAFPFYTFFSSPHAGNAIPARLPIPGRPTGSPGGTLQQLGLEAQRQSENFNGSDGGSVVEPSAATSACALKRNCTSSPAVSPKITRILGIEGQIGPVLSSAMPGASTLNSSEPKIWCSGNSSHSSARGSKPAGIFSK